jgi:hypothetical protein
MTPASWHVEEYRTTGGQAPVRTFLAGLPRTAKADAIALVKLVEGFGSELREPYSKSLGDGLFELRRRDVRIFYVFEPGRVMRLLGGMLKKQDRIPAAVLARMREYGRMRESG